MDATNTTTSATEASDDGVAVAIVICIHTIGWMDACMRPTLQHIYERMDEWTAGRTDGWMDGCLDVWISASNK